MRQGHRGSPLRQPGGDPALKPNAAASVLASLLILLLAGCSSSSPPPPSQSPAQTPPASQAAADASFDVLLTNASEATITSVPKGARIKLALDLQGLTPDPITLDGSGDGILKMEQPLRRASGDQWAAYVRAIEAGTATMSVRVMLDCQATSCRGAGMVRAPFRFRVQVVAA